MTEIMKEAEYSELFIRRIKNLTTPEENEQIDLLLEDPSLRKEFDELILLMEAVKLYEYQKEAESYFKKRPKEKAKGSNGYLWSRAAIFLLFFGVSLLVYLTFSENYLPGINVDAGVVRSVDSKDRPYSTMSPQQAAFERFVQGQAYFSAKDFPKAIELFEEVLKTPDLRNQVREAAEWHLCIAYLSDRQTEKADYWMSEIERIKEPKYKISLLNKIKVKWQILIGETFF